MPNGMHGYHPEDPYSDAIFLSSSHPAVSMRTIADVYRCMENAAGFRNGTERLAVHPGTTNVQTHEARGNAKPNGSDVRG